jgi:predicted acylesterase/phospholipase RssA
MIYTLYSFKGGVGRSMALANLGEMFHEKGLRVIMIDWDLEAPGLETYFYPSTTDHSQLTVVRAHLGLIDMLTAYKHAFPKFAARRTTPVATLPTPEREQYARDLERASNVARKVLEEANVPSFLLDTEERETPQTLPEFLDDLYRPRTSSAVRSEISGPLADSPFREYLQCVRPPDTRQNGLYLLSAGARADDGFGRYAATVQDFAWSEFYAAYEGRQYFTWFRQQLRAIADVILIDSRTGVTEMGGVCTRHIPDVVVSFCAPNFQNIDGVVRVVSGLNKKEVKQARNDRHVDVLIIPARIDDSESDRLGEFSQSFAEKIERDTFVPEPLQDLDRPLWNLQIPYIARYNYREERVIGANTPSPDPATQKLIDAYRRIAVYLAVLAPPDHRLCGVFAGEIATAFPHLSKTTPQMAPVVSETWVERPQEVQNLKQVLLQRAASPQVSRLAVWGLAGSGKTSLVARVCRAPEIVAAYPDGILWLTVDRSWTPSEAQEWLRTSLGMSRQTGERALQQTLSDRRFLLVADDVWQLGDVEAVFKFGAQCTQIVITRDLSVASQFSDVLISVGLLTNDEALALLKTDIMPLAAPDDPRFDLSQQMVQWALGATLARAALERRLAQGEVLSAAWETLRDAFRRHEILAFDQMGAADRTTSVARTLKESIARLNVEEKSLLLLIAKASDGLMLADTTRVEISKPTPGSTDPAKRLRRLADLGLVRVDERAGYVRVHPLIHAYLFAEGELEDQPSGQTKTRRVSSSMDKQNAAADDVEHAKRILRGVNAALDEIQLLAERLKDGRYFCYARRLFARARYHPDAARQPAPRILKLIQRQALCTYRDPDLPHEARFADALAILAQGDLNGLEPSSETLGLAGAVYKYQWKISGRRRDLERSLAFYERGAARSLEEDYGYTAINAAFVLDLLAHQERPDAPDVARRRAEQARNFREQITTSLPLLAAQKPHAWLKNEWWFFATLAEACLGLGRHDEARYWLREGLAVDPPDWQLESTTRQVAALAVAQDQDLAEGAEAYRVLRILVGEATTALRAITIGKVGLALSGGGFRASLFHIGVLARMAELDMLRHVEVLSCVSGGSIVGAHYYLEVRRLLQEKADAEIVREDYIDIVHRLEHEFLVGVQKNLRTRLFASWWANARTIVQPSYTRTTRLGDLFDRHIYARVLDGHHGARWLNDLYIRPKGGPPNFNPKVDNWRQSAKAPILLLNATTLNTGHNWQFAVSWMGEPPLGASSPIDRNDILRRMYYWEAPLRHRRVRLGRAVAASACVPALFDPIEFNGLFPDRVVRLVDGGVHDNQGIAGLLEQECSVMLISDASGQMNTEDSPSGELPVVALRANNVLMARVREAEFRELDLLRRSGALNDLVYLHLKKDLEVSQIDWIDCEDPYESLDEVRPTQQQPAQLTSYGIPRTVQRRLAGIRTDLDSFSDTEAYALMLSGYRMADTEFKECLRHWPLTEARRAPWRFLSIEQAVIGAPGQEYQHAGLLRLLAVSAARGFKIWCLRPLTAALLLLLMAFCIIGLIMAFALRTELQWSLSWPVAQGALLGSVATIAGLFLLAWSVHRLCHTGKSLTVIATGLLMVTVGWLVALLHLAIFDCLYLATGRSRQRAGDSLRP